MDDSPRSSKRRRLDVPDTPKRTVSTPLVKSTLKRASGRLTNRSVSYTVGGAPEDVQEEEEEEEQGDNENDASPTQKVKLPKKAANTPINNVSPRKRTLAAEKDVYDDFEGALSPTPKRRAANTPRAGTSLPRISKRIQVTNAPTNGDISDDPHDGNNNPKSRKTNGAVNGDTPSRSVLRELMNGHKHGTDTDEDMVDELAVEELPTKQRKNARATNGSTKKSTPGRGANKPKSTGRPARTPAKALKIDESRETSHTTGTNGVTPSKLRSTRNVSSSIRKRAASEIEEDTDDLATPSRTSSRKALIDELSTVPDSEEELGDRLSPSRTMSAKARRRSNHTDHIGNQDDIIIPSDDEREEAGAAENYENDDDNMDVDGGSILGSVLDPTEPSPFNQPTSAQKQKDSALFLQLNFSEGRELDLLKSIVMERITAKRPAPLFGLDAEYKTVYQLIEQTITAGEGNSMLLIGARGSGKTALVNNVLSEISKVNREDYHVVRLNGFIHTDDKIALREIWRQLGKEMDIEEDGGLSKNYADTLTTLLALLSHPSEHTGELTDQVAKAVVFVMDEFDLFATHPRQTLLYNLFDIAQSRKAPIAVLGLTTRIDVANSLEKRVKSRFSHRYVHLSLGTSFTAFQELCKASLLIESDQLNIEERSILCAAPAYTPSKKTKTLKKTTISAEHDKTDFLMEWNRSINASLGSEFCHNKSNIYYRPCSHPNPS
jgi:origin recognition complex subunit 4